jgi:hypothetical protein
MVKRTSLLFFCISLFSYLGQAQCDTNFLYLDYLELSFEDSTEFALSLKLINETDTLRFDNFSEMKMIGINKNKECKLIIKTNKSEVILEGINEYISFIKTKYRLSIYMPFNHSTCIEASYFQPDGLILIHSQTMKTETLINCILVDSGPTGYSNHQTFETTKLLK